MYKASKHDYQPYDFAVERCVRGEWGCTQILDALMWAHEPLDENGRRSGIKESTRWSEIYERVAEQAATLPDTRLVYVADREGDIPALTLADTLGHPADWLIRARHNRNLAEGGKLWDKVEASEVLGEIAFILPGRAGQEAREVRQELRASRIELPGKRQLSVTCVVAWEIDAPAGVTPVVWRLVTNRLAPDCDAVIELIDWYRARWGNRTVF
ncbi:MAG: hypothetical protein NVSMB6_23630 [Burkholderiaceae bacterium]